MFNIAPPFYGSAYYPESWDKTIIDEDIRLMKESGLNTARIGEFAWKTMEPQEGIYDFSLFKKVAEKLKENGIAIVMGTPTCTPPAWLTCSHPEIMQINTRGERSTHGARRNACINNPVYLEYCDKIVTEQAKAFADGSTAAENLIGWQIDNELYNNTPDGRGCCCPVCRNKFIQRLKEKYGTIDVLNDAWGLDVWSLRYDSFEQIPVPRHDIWHHPAFLSEWMRFHADSYAEFTARQAEIIRKYSSAPIGTDMMPMYGLDFNDMTKSLDTVQATEYRNSSCMSDLPMWFSYFKNLKNKPFWVVETAASWGGGVIRAWRNEPEFCTANSWLPVAMGADAIMYWLWRAHHSGHELMHGSVITPWGRPSHVFPEIQEVSKGFEKAREILNGTFPVKQPFAMHLSSDAARTFDFQPITPGFQYNAALTESYIALREAHFNPEIIDPACALDDYKVIFSPYLPCIEHKNLADKLYKWIKNGGTWIAGPFTDIRNRHDGQYKEAPFGHLEKWANIRCEFSLPAAGASNIKFSSRVGYTTGHVVFDALTCQRNSPESKKFIKNENTGSEYGTATPMAVYTDNGYLKDYCAATVTEIGAHGGRIIVLGTMPESAGLIDFIGSILESCDIKPVGEASENIVLTPRAGKHGKTALIAVEIKNIEGTVTAPWNCTDILSGSCYKSGAEIKVSPHGVLVLAAC